MHRSETISILSLWFMDINKCIYLWCVTLEETGGDLFRDFDVETRSFNTKQCCIETIFQRHYNGSHAIGRTLKLKASAKYAKIL